MNELARAFLASDDLKRQELFPIREVARMTGVNPVTLRAWERRYGLIQPTRTESGHRLYSAADVEAIRSILAWMERGVAVSKVGRILARNSAVAPFNENPGSGWDSWRQRLWAAVAAFDTAQLQRLYGQILSGYPLPTAFQEILLPAWQGLLVRQQEFGQTSEWLFLDGFLRLHISQRMQLVPTQDARPVLLCSLPEHCRELELLAAGLLLHGEGMPVHTLGPGVPMVELGLICERMAPQALVLFSNQLPTADLLRQLARLALTLECPVLLAGEAADLGEELLAGSSVACLGSDGERMQQRLQLFLAGRLDI